MSFFDEYLKRFAIAHGDTYDYSAADYKGALTKIEIICKQHGSFWQLPVSHSKGIGCPECAKVKRGLTRKKNHPRLSEEERERRRKGTLRRYESKPEVRAANKERRDRYKAEGRSQQHGT